MRAARVAFGRGGYVSVSALTRTTTTSGMAHVEHYRPQDFTRRERDREPPSPRRHVPPIPDLRFEYSYLRSVRPLVHVERVHSQSSPGVDEKGKGVVLDISKPPTAATITPQERITIQWIRLIWITTRDQVLSPFLQGALWCVSALAPTLHGTRH